MTIMFTGSSPNAAANTEAPAPMALYAALVDAQANVGAVAKDSVNQFHRYKYAAAEDVFTSAKAALAGASLALVTLRWYVVPAGNVEADEDGVVTSSPAAHDRLFAVYRLVHRSGEYLDFPTCSTPVIPEKGRPQDKAEATALTFNLSYFLRGLLLIPRADEGTERAKGRDDANSRDDSRYEPRNGARQAPRAQAQQRTQERPQAQAQRSEEPEVMAEKLAESARENLAPRRAWRAERPEEPEDAAGEVMAEKLAESAELAVCAQFEAKLRSAATIQQLRTLGEPIKQSLEKQKICRENYERLVEIYNEVRDSLKRGPGVTSAVPATAPGVASLPAANGASPPANDQTVAS